MDWCIIKIKFFALKHFVNPIGTEFGFDDVNKRHPTPRLYDIFQKHTTPFPGDLYGSEGEHETACCLVYRIL